MENLPLAVGGLLGLLAAGTLAHLLITSIRRRRGDLAVLKILGFVPGQLRRTVAWQANTIAVIALAFGVPIGTIIGRWIWLAFAHQLGVVAVPAVPVISVLILALGALIVANLIALVPSHAAARTRRPDPARRLSAPLCPPWGWSGAADPDGCAPPVGPAPADLRSRPADGRLDPVRMGRRVRR